MSATNTAPRVLMVFPKFYENSMWNFKEAMELQGARAPAPPLGLITLAAMLPKSWDVTLINRNCDTLSDEQILAADLVMTGGMLPQEPDCLIVIDKCRELGVPVCVGGPAPTSTPEVYDKADFLVLGEAEGILDTFVAAWEAGERRGRFTAVKFKADVTKSPIPRFDLLTFSHYLYIGVQFSRGCPFTCEFCDIIELYGRVPRTKGTAQMLAELDSLYARGYRGHIDFVDDNLIGNKKAVKAFLPHLRAWQDAHGHPFEFSTEASVNLSDDAELLGMMRDCGFFAVFVGIESPDADTLVQTQKKQNTRRSLTDSIHRIYEAGIFVVAGFIVGFDSEKGSVAAPMRQLIEDSAIPVAMVGMLYALPNTQLTRRLTREGRLFMPEQTVDDGEVRGDQCTAGLNFVVKRPRREIVDDYRRVIDGIYAPAAFFGRVRRVCEALQFPGRPLRVQWSAAWRESGRFGRLMWGIVTRRPDMRGEVLATVVHLIRCNPAGLTSAMRMTALYVHLGPFSRYVVGELDKQIEALETGQWVQRPLVPVPEPDPAALVA